jgi:NAD-dependent deacetylase
MTLKEGIETLAARIRSGARVTVVTGAGVSAASGVPTFRGPGGLWRNGNAGLPTASYRWPSASVPYCRESASGGRVAANPLLVWEWYAWRRALVARAAPNRADEVLAAWSRRYAGFTLVTQNVDGLHERAGTQNVIRFHGSLWELSCWKRCARSPERWRDETPDFPQLPPRCTCCGGLARPAVIWFGEPIDPAVLAAASAAVECDVCLAVGTSSVVYPAAALLTEAGSRGALTAEINPEPTPATAGVDLALAGPAEEVLDRVERELSGTRFTQSPLESGS